MRSINSFCHRCRFLEKLLLSNHRNTCFKLITKMSFSQDIIHLLCFSEKPSRDKFSSKTGVNRIVDCRYLYPDHGEVMIGPIIFRCPHSQTFFFFEFDIDARKSLLSLQ